MDMNLREELLHRGWFTEKQMATCEANHGASGDGKPVVKLFNAYGNGTWYISEVDSDMVAYGMCYITNIELGYVYLGELLDADIHGKAMIQRDRYIKIPKTGDGVRQQIQEHHGLDRLEEQYA